MEMVTVEFRLPKEIYDKATEILAKQGLTVEAALVLFFEETARLGRIPFEYTEGKTCGGSAEHAAMSGSPLLRQG